MRILKLALAAILGFAILFGTLSCSNNISSDNNASNENGNSTGNNSGNSNNNNSENGNNNDDNNNQSQNKDMTFDLSEAKGFFAGKASTATARNVVRSIARTAENENSILMKIDENGNISPAVTLTDYISVFDLWKILKNPVTQELYLIGLFIKPSINGNGGWDYGLIRVAQDGNWYGVPDSMATLFEPFDDKGNFYYHSGYNMAEGIYKYSNGVSKQLVKSAHLLKVFSNGAFVYSSYSDSADYIKLASGGLVTLDETLSNFTGYGVYVPSKDVYYYHLCKSGYYYIDKDDKYIYDWSTNGSDADGGYVIDRNNKKIYYKESINNKSLIVAKGYNFKTYELFEAYYIIDDNSTESYPTLMIETSSSNVFDWGFINCNGNKYEIQDDLSLKCTYNLEENGYEVFNNNERLYYMKTIDEGKKIFFLGNEKNKTQKNLYKITNFGTPVAVLKENYTFQGSVSFADTGDFIASVCRMSDGKYGTVSGNMDTGDYKFVEEAAFEEVKDILINFEKPAEEPTTEGEPEVTEEFLKIKNA